MSFQEFTRDLLSDIGGGFQTGFQFGNFEGEFALGFFGSSSADDFAPDPPWWDFKGLFPENWLIFNTGGLAVPPVITTPVFERPRGEAPPPIASPLEPQVSIFSDIVGTASDIGTAIGGIFSGGGADQSGGFGVLGDIFTRRTTTAQERVLSGTFFEGDIATAIENIGGAIGAGQSLLRTFQPSLGTGVSTVAGNGISDIAPCPAPGSSQGFPAGACVTIGDWQRAGSPKGFEVAGISGGDTLILRKKRRRRRRSGLTKGMMTDVDYLARKLGKPAAETYLNRVL